MVADTSEIANQHISTKLHTMNRPILNRFDAGKEYPYNPAIMITSKLTSKAQTTIPQPVRAALHLATGDELVYQIDGERVVITKAAKASRGEAADDPFRTFSEWDSAADNNAYDDL